jgi:hypothetical protein
MAVLIEDVSTTFGIILSLFVVDQGTLAERGDLSVFENAREAGIVVRARKTYTTWSRRPGRRDYGLVTIPRESKRARESRERCDSSPR